MAGWLEHFSDRQCTLIESLGLFPWDNPLWDKLVDFVAQDWLALRLPHREQPLQDHLLSVNHAGGSRVSAPAPCTNLQEAAVAGSLRVISATTKALEEHTLRSFTREPPQLLKDMEHCRCLFSGVLPSWSRSAWWTAFSRRVLHLLSCAPITTRLAAVRTVLPPRRYGVMRGVCLVESSFPGGGTRVPFHLAGEVVAY